MSSLCSQNGSGSVGRPAQHRPTEPWRPVVVRVRPVQRGTSKTRATRTRPARERPCWTVFWSVDGQRFNERFDRAADAEALVSDLQRGAVAQLFFDPRSRRFVDDVPTAPLPTPGTAANSEPSSLSPAGSAPTAGISIAAWTQRYWDWKWPTLEPKGRRELSRYLNRVRGHFVSGVEPGSEEAGTVAAYLRRCSLTVAPVEPTDVERVGGDLLRKHSDPLAEVGRTELEGFVAHYSVHHRDPNRMVSAATTKRMVADLKQCWARAVQEDVLDTNPWDRVELPRGGRGAGGRSAKAGVAPADAELVLSPDQILVLADRATVEGTWGEVVRCFVLVMGFCGLRPSEATGLVVGDIDLPPTGAGWLTVRRSQRQIPARFLDTNDDPDWGPLKGRHLSDTRRVPIPASIVPALADHLARFCAGARPTDLVFQRNAKPFDLSNFGDDVWDPTRRSLFPMRPDLSPDSPLQPRLSRLRRHDLRHSACSMWLRARVDVSVCQRWSGHKRLSVFLDIYQGLIPGREEEGIRLVNNMLDLTR